ncbi:MAG: hypothetical protein H6797_05700 [Candidatus Nomurabacteria bacterium]|nr:MAG: hypothetical protein H6797_05700 [Candidatus Nomurabacteria bacterium]
MPPVENNTPAPQEPKKGFFARLFGGGKKKEAAGPVVPPAHESLTPEPQLDDVQADVPSDGSTEVGAPSVSVEQASSVESSPVEASPVVSEGDTSVTPTAEPSVEESKPPVGPVPPAQ